MKAHIQHTRNVGIPDIEVTCNEGCGKKFILKSDQYKEEYIGNVADFGEVTRQYFECPLCGHKYSTGWLNDEVRALIEETQEVMRTDFTSNANYKIQRLRDKGKLLMERIRVAYEKTKT